VLSAPCSCLRRHPSSPAPSPTSIIHFSICRRTLPQAPAAATPAIDKTACRLVPAGCNSHHTPLSRLDSTCLGLSPIEEREPLLFLAYISGLIPHLSINCKMSLEAPTYLASLQNNIRQRPIPWDGAVRSGLVTDSQLALIRALDRAKKTELKKSIIENDLDGYTALWVGDKAASRLSVLESAAKQPAIIQYLLVLLGDLIECRFIRCVILPLPPHHVQNTPSINRHQLRISISHGSRYRTSLRPRLLS